MPKCCYECDIGEISGRLCSCFCCYMLALIPFALAFSYYGVGFKDTELGQCLVRNYTIQYTRIDTGRTIDDQYRAYFCVDFMKENERNGGFEYTNVAAVADPDNIRWESSEDTAFDQGEKYSRGKICDCVKGTNVIPYRMDDINASINLIILGTNVRDMKIRFWVTLVFGIIFAGILTLITLYIFLYPTCNTLFKRLKYSSIENVIPLTNK